MVCFAVGNGRRSSFLPVMVKSGKNVNRPTDKRLRRDSVMKPGDNGQRGGVINTPLDRTAAVKLNWDAEARTLSQSSEAGAGCR
ncbi:hypothetical protein [Planctomicrobium piriforme]|uniref:Uncharacterized protein n=1 Tax=Planctomicrobium piriforme TaxID=1576369 RepID=A0A1I3IPQ9_9PLAN|nr:hypothetical protein [Planctomicrobium piriforme]SFI49902.1 hypothetical protein SAMN05421753_109206 [Planctomicrobium piriforme]